MKKLKTGLLLSVIGCLTFFATMLSACGTEKVALSTTDTTNDTANGNIPTTNAGNSNYVRAVSKPNVTSWRWITVGNMYTNSYYYDRNKDSHLMKNSEWGAVRIFNT